MFQQTSYTDQLTFFQKLRSFDYILFFLILVIGIISIFAMYSSDGGDFSYHTKCHLLRFSIFFLMMIFMEKGNTYGQMEIHLEENGRRIKWKKGCLSGAMGENIKVNIKMVRNMDMGC